jgi:hypothetical protein
VQVIFRKMTEQRCSTWDAIRGKRTRVPGATMALGRGDLPHDLTQMVVEATLGVTDGFWGCVAQGATFRSTGRKRTRPGRAVIAAHRRELIEAEQIVGAHVRAWQAGRPTPAGDALDRFDRLWRALGDGGSLGVQWPTLRIIGTKEESRPSPIGAGRCPSSAAQASVSQASVRAALHENPCPPMPAALRGS